VIDTVRENFFKIDFCFREGREYVQGSDIFDLSVSKVRECFDVNKIIDFNFYLYKILTKNAYIFILDSINNIDNKNINSLLTFNYLGEKVYVAIVERDSKIECFSTCNERQIYNNLIIKRDSAEIYNIENYSTTDIAIQINKYILNNTTSKKGKWIVVKIEGHLLSNLLNFDDRKIEVKVVNIYNGVFSKSSVMANNKKVLNLYFSLV